MKKRFVFIVLLFVSLTLAGCASGGISSKKWWEEGFIIPTLDTQDLHYAVGRFQGNSNPATTGKAAFRAARTAIAIEISSTILGLETEKNDAKIDRKDKNSPVGNFSQADLMKMEDDLHSVFMTQLVGVRKVSEKYIADTNTYCVLASVPVKSLNLEQQQEFAEQIAGLAEKYGMDSEGYLKAIKNYNEAKIDSRNSFN